jgi:hypothetical protein
MWVCSKKQLNSSTLEIIEDIPEDFRWDVDYMWEPDGALFIHDEMEEFYSYKFTIFNKLGDFTLGSFLQSNIKEKELYIKQTLFQIIIFMVYMRRYTNIMHGDLHEENVILKKNDKELFICLFDKI